MDADERRIRAELEALATRVERRAESEVTVTARIDTRLRPRPTLHPATVAVVLAVIGLAVGLRYGLTLPAGPAPSPVPVVGLFRSTTPDGTGRCVAVRLYPTTSTDGRAAVWTWAGADGCAARSSNLSMRVGSAATIGLPARPSVAARTGIAVMAAATPVEPAVDVVFDPSAAIGTGDLPGYWSPADVAGPSTLAWHAISEVSIPYVVP